MKSNPRGASQGRDDAAVITPSLPHEGRSGQSSPRSFASMGARRTSEIDPRSPLHSIVSPRRSMEHHMTTLATVCSIFREIDFEYFGGAAGNEAMARSAALALSDEHRNSALQLMYGLLSQCAALVDRTLRFSLPASFAADHMGSLGQVANDGRSPASDALAPPSSSVRRTESKLSAAPDRMMLNVNSDLLGIGARTPSMASMGGLSVVSQSRAPVQHTDTVVKGFDDESGNKTINEYVVLGDLGKGSQGKVKLVFDTLGNQLRAIKAIRRPPLGPSHGIGGRPTSDDQRRRIEQEIAITKRLRHKNLASLIEVIDDPEHNKLYLVFQHVPNGALGKIQGCFCTQRYDDARVTTFARQLTAGLQYLHCHGVIHRDIKPENILRGEGDDVYLIDFGISEMISAIDEDCETAGADTEAWSQRRIRLRGTRVTVRGSHGTAPFIAPELLVINADKASSPTDGDGSNDESVSRNRKPAASCSHCVADSTAAGSSAAVAAHAQLQAGDLVDVWALGVTLFALLCGRLPWITEDQDLPADNPERYHFNAMKYFDMVCRAEPLWPPQVSLFDKSKEMLFDVHHFHEREDPLPKHWRELLGAMLCKDPAKRMTLAEVRRAVKAIRSSNVGAGFRRPSLPSLDAPAPLSRRNSSPPPVDVAAALVGEPTPPQQSGGGDGGVLAEVLGSRTPKQGQAAGTPDQLHSPTCTAVREQPSMGAESDTTLETDDPSPISLDRESTTSSKHEQRAAKEAAEANTFLPRRRTRQWSED